MQHLKRTLFAKFRDAETRLHELNYLFWECTLRCNLQCLHCGSDCSRSSNYIDMPVNDFFNALQTIQHIPQNFTVVFTGGEPLMRNDIEECGRQIRKLGMQWGIVSNGVLYNEARHNSLLNAGMGALTISLDGMRNSHNHLRSTPGSFEKATRAIEMAAKAPQLNFDVVSCVNPMNIHELDAMHQLLESLNVKSWRLFTITPIGRAANNPDLMLTAEQFEELMQFIVLARRNKRMNVKFSCESYVGNYEAKVRDSYFFCRAGINIASVLIDGSISACPNIDRSMAQGNIYHDNLQNIWDAKFQLFRNRSWTKKGVCASCSDYKYCQGSGMHLYAGNPPELLQCRKL